MRGWKAADCSKLVLDAAKEMNEWVGNDDVLKGTRLSSRMVEVMLQESLDFSAESSELMGIGEEADGNTPV